MTVQCLQGFNIFVITELTIAILLAQMFVERHQMTSLFFHQACGLLKTIEPPSSFVASYQTLRCGTSQAL
jgi:hypothetical protein